ncbi:MAG TPA: hypothetical protein VK184_08965 [Nostocaceae cyanobacterium]|nr:hypothetical protein [Nostocaceae cyanobacterium]
MLKIEINQNIDALREFCRKSNLNKSDDAMIFAKKLISNSLPESNRKVWNSEVLILPLALSQEEIKDIYNLYEQIDKISKQYSRLADLFSEIDSFSASLRVSSENLKVIQDRLTKREKINNQIEKLVLEFKTLIHEITEDRYWWS